MDLDMNSDVVLAYPSATSFSIFALVTGAIRTDIGFRDVVVSMKYKIHSYVYMYYRGNTIVGYDFMDELQ